MLHNRREFLKGTVVGAAAIASLRGEGAKPVRIVAARDASFRRRLAERELLRGLLMAAPEADIRLSESTVPAALTFTMNIDRSRFQHPEGYEIAATGTEVAFLAAGELPLLYAVFDFLDRQGAYFGIDGPSYPPDGIPALILPPPVQPWVGEPRFAVRGLLPWPDFLNCITVYDDEDFRAYFEAMLRMRFNTFGMHVYTQGGLWAEPYLSFEFAGVGHRSTLDTTATHRWGYIPQRTSRYVMGAPQFFDGEVFGSDATRLGRDPWEIADRTRELLRRAFAHARRLGIRTGIGFEPYQIPDDIFSALPPEARREGGGARFDIDSVTARDMLETRLAQLLEAYPDVDYVWLWEDEGMNWESRKKGLPLKIAPFVQARQFLKRHAPDKRLVVAGWGGVARNFAEFHQRLPADIVFSCLSDSLGWDPVHEVFGQLEGRERWPILWIEDDPSMWLPQFHVHRFKRDMDLAEKYGCQGLIGIHWRHRIVDATAGFQARASWRNPPAPEAHYLHYARSQAGAARAPKLGAILNSADRENKLLSTGGDQVKNGHVVQHEWSGDYAEGFLFWYDYVPQEKVIRSEREVAEALRALTDSAASPSASARLQYLSRHVEFLVPYADAWILAHRMHNVLAGAAELHKAGQAAEAHARVLAEAVPLWVELAPKVRQVMLGYQSIVSTRNDLGQLASMQNKFVRLALVRLRLSMKECLGELPPETETLFRKVIEPDPAAPNRVFIPTRPTLLSAGESVRLLIVAPGPEHPGDIVLYTRPRGGAWTQTRAQLKGRRTYSVTLGPFDPRFELVDYYAASGRLAAPPGAPKEFYTLTLA